MNFFKREFAPRDIARVRTEEKEKEEEETVVAEEQKEEEVTDSNLSPQIACT